jgi:hypothetical protein
MKGIINWIRFHIFGIGRCESCHGTGNSDRPYGDAELLGSNAYHPCKRCNGTGHAEDDRDRLTLMEILKEYIRKSAWFRRLFFIAMLAQILLSLVEAGVWHQYVLATADLVLALAVTLVFDLRW